MKWLLVFIALVGCYSDIPDCPETQTEQQIKHWQKTGEVG